MLGKEFFQISYRVGTVAVNREVFKAETIGLIGILQFKAHAVVIGFSVVHIPGLSHFTGGAVGFRLPLASPLFRLAEDVLREMDSRGAVFYWNGASIPIVSTLRDVSSAAPLIVGWGQSEDRIHSPNESYSLRQFALSKEWAKRILGALA